MPVKSPKQLLPAAVTLTTLWLLAAAIPVRGQDAGAATNNLVYQIFVRSFFDGKPDAQGIGDLAGVTSRLDSYLNDGNPATRHDLSVGILWLMPVFPADSYHGYDVTDFRAIHPHYGDLGDFRRLVQASHARGMRVILDIPFNHTSRNHPWFRAALSDATAPQRNYYHIQPEGDGCPATYHRVTAGNGEKLCYQGVFGGGMPDLKIENPQAQQEIFHIARYWLEQGADGFRLDAAKHLFGRKAEPEEQDTLDNNRFWRDFSHFVYRIKPDAVLVGEVLGDRERLRRYAYGLDALVDEPFMEAVRHHVDFPQPGLISAQKQALERARQVNAQAYGGALPFPDVPFHFFPYVASHDKSPRLASFLKERRRHGMGRSVDAAYRLAGYYLLTGGRCPIIYNGDEIMQEGWKWKGAPRHEGGDGSGIYDETLREPFPWFGSGAGTGQTRWFAPRFDRPHDGVSVQEQSRPGGMLDLWRGLANFRARHPALANGEFGTIAKDDGTWRVFEKTQGAQRYLVLINQTGQGHDYQFNAGHLPAYRQARDLFWSDGGNRTWRDQGGITARIDGKVFVPPYGLVVLRP